MDSQIRLRIITLDDYFKLHGEPATGPAKAALMANAEVTVDRWCRLLEFASADGVSPTQDEESLCFVASGYRPAGVNAKTSNAATASTHLTCEGMDVRDARPDRPLARWVLSHLKIAEEIGLWFEDPRWCWRNVDDSPTEPGKLPDGHPWVHGQTKPPHSGNRVYIPAPTPPTAPPLPEQA